MIKKHIFVLLTIFTCLSLSAQQWEWSKVLPKFQGFSLRGNYSQNTGEHYFIYQTLYGTTPNKSKILHMDASGNISDSLNLDFNFEKISVDLSGNFLLTGLFTDSFQYAGAVIHERAFINSFLLKITPTGGLVFLKYLGSANGYSLGGLAGNPTGLTYLHFDILQGTFYLGPDSINDDTSKRQIVLAILNPNGSLNTLKIRTYPDQYWSGYNAAGVSITNNNDLFTAINYCYPYDCNPSMIQLSPIHDSINSFPGAQVDEQISSSYYLHNAAGHYWWEPILHRFNIGTRTMAWSKSIGSDYSPFLFSYRVLPDNKILTYGFGGGPNGGTGTATLDDTSFTFGNKTEMLLALMDTSGHYYTAMNERVPNTRFTSASYDLTGNAYLISAWNIDTTYTMGSQIQTVNGDKVISKLNYMQIAAGLSSKESKPDITIFPNPSNGKFNVRMNNNIHSLSICIYNLLGNCISLQKTNNTKAHIIDLTNQAKGIYFVEIMADNQKFNTKIVIN